MVLSSRSNAGESSLQRAKFNIEKYYSVVGMLEDFPNFFKTLEYIFPQYFAGAVKFYNSKYKMTSSFVPNAQVKEAYYPV